MRDLAGSNSELAADHNRGVVLRAIHRHRPISRTELAKRSGLTKQAVARIVERLIDEGLVIEARRRRGVKGQPAIELEIDPGGASAVGISLARDYVTAIAVDAVGNVRGRVHAERRFIPPDEFFEFVEGTLSTFRHRRAIDPGRMAGIGIAVPDWLGEIPFPGMTDDFRRWSGTDIRGRMRRIADHPVFIENDATAATIGELNYGLGLEARNFFYVFVGAGLGGGVVLDGVCHHGTSGLAGEIGWLPTVGPAGAGGEARPLGRILSLYALYDHLAAHGHPVAEPQELLRLDETGSALVSDWLRAVAAPVAEAAANIGLLLDPDAVMVGGRLPVRLIDELLLYVHDILVREGREAPPIHRAVGSEDAAARGAAAMPLADLLRLDSRDPNQRLRSPLGSRDAVTGADRAAAG
ncbi:ROK family transcriptional regulator [Aureimonas leprariae]|uniref:ROK family transcriptional regulator n=1 Tax=Plantimonas leprariae TaxID=2615207 RepID=A0A7V7TWW1_9HYPH|nr:ROK family transcriptional regulator [Aureimonas leprariae]KAB0680250.1 ROK family transcriptional regulator [Aureimonas leprariae]